MPILQGRPGPQALGKTPAVLSRWEMPPAVLAGGQADRWEKPQAPVAAEQEPAAPTDDIPRSEEPARVLDRHGGDAPILARAESFDKATVRE